MSRSLPSERPSPSRRDDDQWYAAIGVNALLEREQWRETYGLHSCHMQWGLFADYELTERR